MKKKVFFVIVLIAAALLFVWQYSKGAVSAIMSKPGGNGFFPPLTNLTKRLCDGYGCGDFGASRDNGARTHKGQDYLTQIGQDVFSPISGTARVFYPYKGNDKLKGVEIKDGALKVKIMYLEPDFDVFNGAEIEKGQYIGAAQSLQSKYPGIPNHIHLELWVFEKAVNPNDYFL